MLGEIFRRIRKHAPPHVSTPKGATSMDETSTSMPAREPQTVAPPVQLAPQGADVAAWLELDVRTRVAALLNALGRDDTRSDAPIFLEALTSTYDAVVKQPPLAAQRALSITRDPAAPSRKLVGLVETDPGLTQGLLRYANSAWYAVRGGSVVSLHGAVQRVGTTGVHNVVLKVMVDGMLCRPGAAWQDIATKVWQHMIRTAPIARAIAPACGVPPDEAFALGLLHDVGKLVVFDRLGELRRVLKRDIDMPRHIMSQVLRSLHEPLGGIAALQWGLGPAVAHSIATHHRSPAPAMFDGRGELLYLAERIDLCHISGVQVGHLPFEQWARDGALNVDQSAVAAAIEEMSRVVDEPL